MTKQEFTEWVKSDIAYGNDAGGIYLRSGRYLAYGILNKIGKTDYIRSALQQEIELMPVNGSPELDAIKIAELVEKTYNYKFDR